MLIKYTDWYETITIRVPELNFNGFFQRNVWKNVPDSVAKELLKNSHFVCEEDIKIHSGVFDGKKHFLLNRFGALGDLIMLLPVVRYLIRTTDHKFSLATSQLYVPTFRPFKEFVEVITSSSMDKNKYDRVFYLDGVLECDHSLTADARMKHRVHLYEEFFGIKVDKYDFSFPVYSDIESIKRLLQC